MQGIYDCNDEKFLMNRDGSSFSRYMGEGKLPSLGQTCDFIYDSLYNHFNCIDKTLVQNLLKDGIATSTSICARTCISPMNAYELTRPEFLDILNGKFKDEMMGEEDREGLAKLINFTRQRIDYPNSPSSGMQFGIRLKKIDKTGTSYVHRNYHLELFRFDPGCSDYDPDQKFVRLLVNTEE